MFSYVESDCQTAQTLQQQNQNNQDLHWWQGTIQQDRETIIDINDLLAFYRHPQEYFFRRQLGIRWQGVEKLTDEREPFVVDGLDAYLINQQWITDYLEGKYPEVKKLQAQGRWLSSTPGIIEFHRQQEKIQKFVGKIQNAQMGEPMPEIAIDISVNDFRLLGKLGHIYQNGSLFYRYAKLKGKDFMQAWLHHLLLNQLQKQPTWLMSSDKNLMFPAESSSIDILTQLLRLYIQGQTNPHLFFVEPALVYIQQLSKSKSKKSPLEAAQEHWLKSISSGYEPALYKLYKNIENPELFLNKEFEQICLTLLHPGWEAASGD